MTGLANVVVISEGMGLSGLYSHDYTSPALSGIIVFQIEKP
jgi:hypothetical protein